MIREANLLDLGGLSNLFDQYRVFYKYKSDLLGARTFLTERLVNNESKIFIALNTKNEPIGFVQLYPIFSSTRMRPLWLLNDLYVESDYRNKGFGKALLAKAKAFAIQSNACGLLLETAKTNHLANQLYTSTDWTMDYEHNYYTWEIE